jgi:acetyltransferase-like isoleucine patch superfamily enzyme
MNKYISPRAEVPDSVYIGQNVRIYGPVSIGEDCVLEDNVIIGKPDMFSLDDFRNSTPNPTLEDYEALVSREVEIGEKCVIGTGTHIYEGSIISSETEIEDYVRIGWDSEISKKTRIMYRAQIYVGTTIGKGCRVAGYVGNDTVLENRVAFFGSTVHDYPYRTTSPEPRPAPHICEDSIVAFGAVIIGGVEIGSDSYVGANAIITQDVPDGYVAFLNNQTVPKSEWHGKLGHFEETSSS